MSEDRSSELEQARLEVAAWREQAKEAQELIRDAHDAGLQRIAYETEIDFSDREAAVALADAMLASGDSYRTHDFISEWHEADPQMASQWVATREAQATQAAIRADTEAARAELAQQAAERAGEIEEWRTKRGDVAANFLADHAAEIGASPQDLETLHQGLREADRASAQAEREREIRQAFSQPRFADDFRRDRVGREPAPEVTAADVAARIRPTGEQRRAQREREVADFRAAWAEEVAPKFGRGLQ